MGPGTEHDLVIDAQQAGRRSTISKPGAADATRFSATRQDPAHDAQVQSVRSRSKG